MRYPYSPWRAKECPECHLTRQSNGYASSVFVRIKSGIKSQSENSTPCCQDTRTVSTQMNGLDGEISSELAEFSMSRNPSDSCHLPKLVSGRGVRRLPHFQEWRLVSKRGLPPNVPACPHSTYRNEWQGWGDFLGTFRPPTSAVPMLPYSDAKAWARSEQIRSLKEWVSRRKLGLPRGIPTNPNRSYRALWQGWPAFLGTEAERGRRKQNWGILRGSS
jgi:hypothetical protein